MSTDDLLLAAVRETEALLPKLAGMGAGLAAVAGLCARAIDGGGKILTCGNGGSMADAMHLAEELSVRFQKNRRALAALALSDAAAITCAGNDFGYDTIFSRQVEALGRKGDLLVVFSTSGNSGNCIAAVAAAKKAGMMTAAFLGKGGGKLGGTCDAELVVAAETSHRVQEGHKFLYHVLCEWMDERYGQ
jgi:D-sedoheptulose 7-phosphate isomerase